MANQVLRFNAVKDAGEIELDLIIALDKNGLTKEQLDEALTDAYWEVSADDQGRLIIATKTSAYEQVDEDEDDEDSDSLDDEEYT
jgi:hypothetical protein